MENGGQDTTAYGALKNTGKSGNVSVFIKSMVKVL